MHKNPIRKQIFFLCLYKIMNGTTFTHFSITLFETCILVAKILKRKFEARPTSKPRSRKYVHERRSGKCATPCHQVQVFFSSQLIEDG